MLHDPIAQTIPFSLHAFQVAPQRVSMSHQDSYLKFADIIVILQALHIRGKPVNLLLHSQREWKEDAVKILFRHGG